MKKEIKDAILYLELSWGANEEEEWHIIKKALTTPTEQEVCEALSEYMGRKTYCYDKTDKSFDDTYNDNQVCYFEGETVMFRYDLPPHLITLIGRFYEAQEEADNERTQHTKS